MAHASQSRFPRRSGPRRRVSWAQGPNGRVLGISGPSANLFNLGAQALSDDLTVVRTRGQLILQLVTADALGSGFQWFFGMCNVTENAFGVGVTAVPDPSVDIDWDGWFVYETGFLIAVDSSPAENADNAVQVITIDSKAMRKTHNTDVLIAALGVIEFGTCTMQGVLSTRVLDKLP